ncbi:MAG: O-antigen ligase family protein [Paenibacillaceae bacterium]|nr:O-antigen ligase family protein [Paenibacillaceae bacterium]
MVADRRIWIGTGGVAALLAAIAAATLANALPLLAMLAGAALLLLAVMRAPIVLLMAYVAVIPLEDGFYVTGIGSVTKIFGLLFAGFYLLTQLRRLQVNVIPAGVWIWYGWELLSLVWSANTHTSIYSVSMLAQQFLMVLLFANVVAQNPRALMLLLWTFAASNAVMSVFGIKNFLADLDSLLDPGRYNAYPGQSVAHFAAVIIPAVLFLVNRVMQTRTQSVRVAALALLALCGMGVLVSGTRSAWIGVVVALAYMLMQRFTFKKAVMFAVVLAMLAVSMVYVPKLNQLVTERSSTAVESGGAGRTGIWYAGLHAYMLKPALGWGVGNFRNAKPFPDEMQRGSHNIYLGEAVSTGTIGLLILLGMLVSLYRWPAGHRYAVIVRSMLIAYAVEGFFLDIVNRKYLWFAIALVIGLGAARRKEVQDEAAIERTVAHPVVPDRT